MTAGRHLRLRLMTSSVLTIGSLGLVLAGGGCEKKEKILEIKTPGLDVEVNKTTSGDGDVQINSDNKAKIEIQTRKHKKP